MVAYQLHKSPSSPPLYFSTSPYFSSLCPVQSEPGRPHSSPLVLAGHPVKKTGRVNAAPVFESPSAWLWFGPVEDKGSASQ